MATRELLVGAAVVGSGLNAGLFWAYQTSVVPALRRAADTTYLEAFQHINVAIENPAFLVVFTGTPLVLVAATVATGNPFTSRPAALLAAASVASIVGVIGVTVLRNIPLNERMAALDLTTATDVAAHGLRTSVEAAWARWNTVRTVAAVVSFGLAVAAAVGVVRS